MHMRGKSHNSTDRRREYRQFEEYAKDFDEDNKLHVEGEIRRNPDSWNIHIAEEPNLREW